MTDEARPLTAEEEAYLRRDLLDRDHSYLDVQMIEKLLATLDAERESAKVTLAAANNRQWDELLAARAATPGYGAGAGHSTMKESPFPPRGAATPAAPEALREATDCPDCGHAHLPMPDPWRASDGHWVVSVCDWPMGPDACDCKRLRP